MQLTLVLVVEDLPRQERFHRHRWISLPKPRYSSKAHASSQRFADGPTRWAHNPSSVWNPHHGEDSGRRRHDRDSKGPRAKAPRSGACNMPLLQPFLAPTDNVRNTTDELCSVTTQYAASSKAAQLCSAPSDSREASFDVAI
jgi:hypothetical protein